jgi:DNA polymerase-1
MHILRNWMDIRIIPFFDTMIAQALLDENQSKALKDVAPYYLGVTADRFGSIFGKVTFDKAPILLNPVDNSGNLSSYYAIKDTELTFMLAKFQSKHIYHPRLAKIKSLFFDIEMPFLEIVANAEATGVSLDVDYLVNKVSVDLRTDLVRLRLAICAFTGDINLNAPAQLAEALYVKMGLPRVNAEKPNSTDAKTLKLLKRHHKIVGDIQEYKQKAKLTQAFAEKLPKAIVNGRVHTSFNPVGTKTGRMSCNAPNLQQIPAKVGGLIRNAFVADLGRLLASIDFSQQELRVLAHVSKDEVLLDAYRRGLDIHSLTAQGMYNSKYPEHQCSYEVFEYWRGMRELFQDENGKLVDERFNTEYVTKLFNEGKIKSTDFETLRTQVEYGNKAEKVRKDAKVINFGIIYGMSKYKLADTLEITVDEAQAYINAYFAQYPGVQRWMNEQRFKMKREHCTETMLHRKRRVYQEMKSDKFWMVQKGFRQGINAVIQGSSADMVKIASIKMQPLLKELGVGIVLWVHDEIIFDCPENIGMDNLRRIADVMCTALPLDCGLKSDIEVGRKWGQRMDEDTLARLMVVQMDEEDDGVSGDIDTDENEEEAA